jgi:hypothetical protein
MTTIKLFIVTAIAALALVPAAFAEPYEDGYTRGLGTTAADSQFASGAIRDNHGIPVAATSSSDFFDRLAAAHQPPREPVVDDRFRLEPPAVTTQVSATSSDRDVEWPQIGLGLIFGMALALGVYLTLTRTRQPAL